MAARRRFLAIVNVETEGGDVVWSLEGPFDADGVLSCESLPNTFDGVSISAAVVGCDGVTDRDTVFRGTYDGGDLLHWSPICPDERRGDVCVETSIARDTEGRVVALQLPSILGDGRVFSLKAA